MPQSLFLQNVIALVWDFDRTLIPGYMQGPLFARFRVEEAAFWREVNALPEYYQRRGLTLVSKDTLYLDHIITSNLAASPTRSSNGTSGGLTPLDQLVFWLDASQFNRRQSGRGRLDIGSRGRHRHARRATARGLRPG